MGNDYPSASLGGAGAAAPMAPGTGRCYGDTKSCRAAKSTDLRNRSPPPHLPMLFFGFGLFFFRCRRSPDRFISSVRDLKRSPVSGRRTSCEEGEEKAARDAPMDPELFLRPSAAPSRTPPWAVGGARPPGTCRQSGVTLWRGGGGAAAASSSARERPGGGRAGSRGDRAERGRDGSIPRAPPRPITTPFPGPGFRWGHGQSPAGLLQLPEAPGGGK